MNEIKNKGNLPRHLRVLSGELGGKLSGVTGTKFYEIKTIAEFEKNAVDVGYEIVPTIDSESDRGFLVGFAVESPERIATLVDYAALSIYFVECSDKEVEAWTQKIQDHRLQQQQDMHQRREKAQEKQSQKSPIDIIKP